MDQHEVAPEVSWARDKLTAAVEDPARWAVVIELARAKLAPETWPELADLVRPVLAIDLDPELRKSRIWQLSCEGVPWFRTLIMEVAADLREPEGDDGASGDPMAGYAAWVAMEMERPGRWLTSYGGGADAFDVDTEELLELVELEAREFPGLPEPSFAEATGGGPIDIPLPEPVAVAPVDPAAPPARPAYPLIDCPPVWVTDEEQQVTIGLTPKVLQAVGATGAVVAADESTVDDLTVALLLDPQSITVAAGAARTFPLPVTAAQRFPTVTVGLTAVSGAGLATERRIGLHFRRGGRSVGLAWRRIATVDTAGEVAGARAPAPPSDLLDLSSLVDEEPPDLVLAVYRGDDLKGTLIWEAFSIRDEDGLPDPEPSTEFGDAEAATFADKVRRAAEKGSGRVQLADLEGLGFDIGRTLPVVVRDLLRRTVSRPGEQAPTVLLLTEDPSIPWELTAVENPRFNEASDARSTSPLLGAHVGIGRWPLVSKPRPVPRSRHQITTSGVLSAFYDQVKGFDELPEAENEAAELLKQYGGAKVEPRWAALNDCLEGQPPLDWLHVALHGKFDITGEEDGLVLLDGPPDDLKPLFFKPTHVSRLTFARSSFVFLNACQVGTGSVVLGNHGGMAVAMLRAGASAVVASIWKVDDAMAAAVTQRFYAATLPLDGTPAVSLAEALRRERASYTEERVLADPASCHPTLLAYQLHGHPNLTLFRATPEEN